MVLQLLQSAADSIKFGRSIGTGGRLDRTIFFAPLIEGTLGDVQLFVQCFDGLSFFITADGFDLEFSWIGGRHSLNPFVDDTAIVTQANSVSSRKEKWILSAISHTFPQIEGHCIIGLEFFRERDVPLGGFRLHHLERLGFALFDYRVIVSKMIYTL